MSQFCLGILLGFVVGTTAGAVVMGFIATAGKYDEPDEHDAALQRLRDAIKPP